MCSSLKAPSLTEREIKQIPEQLNLLQRTRRYDLPVFWSLFPLASYPLSPPSDYPPERFWCLSVIHLPSYIGFSTPCLSSYSISGFLLIKSSALSFISPPLSSPLCFLLHQPGEPTATGATTTRAGGSAGSTRGTATEREGTTAASQARATTTATSEPKKKNPTHPLYFFSSAADRGLPVSLSPPLLHPTPASLHRTALPCP